MYVSRNGQGRIVALSSDNSVAKDSPGIWSEIPDDDPEVAEFIRKLAARTAPKRCAKAVRNTMEKHAPGLGRHCPRGVTASDASMVRVLEDLIHVLVERGVIRFTDLPAAAQTKLNERAHWRTEMQELSLLDDDSEVI